MIPHWLGCAIDDAVFVLDEAAVAQARERTRAVGRATGLVDERLERLVAAVSELANNQLAHARGGVIAIRPCRSGTVVGVEVIAADRGAGLSEPGRALTGSFDRVTGSLGVGISAVRRLVDELDVDVRRGEGTCFWARKYAEPVSRGREVGIWGQPKAGETISGDDAIFRRGDAALLLTIADGLGHGPSAREASRTIIDGVSEQTSFELAPMIATLDERARETRGAAVTIVRVDQAASIAECASVGNVGAFIHHGAGVHRFAGMSWTVGGKHPHRGSLRLQQAPLPVGAALVLYSDGVSSKLSLQTAALHDHPVVIAHAIAVEFGRSNDDVTVIVVR